MHLLRDCCSCAEDGYLPSLVLKVDVCQFQNIFMDVEAAELRANNAQAETISPHSRLWHELKRVSSIVDSCCSLIVILYISQVRWKNSVRIQSSTSNFYTQHTASCRSFLFLHQMQPSVMKQSINEFHTVHFPLLLWHICPPQPKSPLCFRSASCAFQPELHLLLGRESL